jgi:hypothetical protein
MDELDEISTLFKPKRQATTNVSAGSASEDGDYKALNEKRKVCLLYIYLFVSLMVFNAIFNNTSAISWRSVLLVEETRGPQKTTDLAKVTDKFYHIMLYTSKKINSYFLAKTPSYYTYFAFILDISLQCNKSTNIISI